MINPHLAAQAARVHDDLQAYLLRDHARVPVPAIVTALTFEIGRLVAAAGFDVADVDAVIMTIGQTLREQIAAHRAGRLAP